METPAVSVTTESAYTQLVSPCHDAYCTLSQTSLNSPRAQRTEKSVGSSHPYRLAAVCLGLLCALLLAASLVLSVLYARQSQHYSQLERDLEELRASNNTVKQDRDQLQKDISVLRQEKDQLQRENNNLKQEKDQLDRGNNDLKKERDQVQGENDNLKLGRKQLQRENNNLKLERDQRLRENNILNQERENLQVNYTILKEEKDQLQREYNNLKQKKDNLQPFYDTPYQDEEQLQRNCNVLKLKELLLQMSVDLALQERDQLQRDFSATFVKLSFMEQFCPYSSQKGESKPCPQGWRQFHSKCYYFSTERKSWAESRGDCMKQGADLVTIKCKEEQDFISKHLRWGSWIGLSHSVSDSTWYWVDGTRLLRGFWHSWWLNNHQSGYSKMQNQVAYCAFTSLIRNRWTDEDCKFRFWFICETDALFHS